MAQYTIDNRPWPINTQGTDAVQRTLQNAKNLLMTRMGEVPYDRLRGFDPALFDLPLTQLRTELQKELDRVLLWEPDAELVSAEATLDENGEVYISMIVEIDMDEEA